MGENTLLNWVGAIAGVAVLGAIQLFYEPQERILFGVIVVYSVIFLALIVLSLSVDTKIVRTFSKHLVGELEALQTSGSHRLVVAFGLDSARHCFVTGRYKTQYAIGQIVEDSARELGDTDALLEALLDPLGWCQVLLDQADDAETVIRDAIEIAEKNKRLFWEAKGWRHLGASRVHNLPEDSTRRHVINEASGYFDDAIRIAEKMPAEDEARRIQMIAGTRYDQVTLELKKGDPDEEEVYRLLGELEELFDGLDKWRQCRIPTLKAEVMHFFGENLRETIREAEEGKRLAIEASRVDEIIRACDLLARLYGAAKNQDARTKALRVIEDYENNLPEFLAYYGQARNRLGTRP